MAAKDDAFRASLNNTQQRIEQSIQRQEQEQNTPPATTFAGVDEETGQVKVQANTGCGSEAIAVGKDISIGSIPWGDGVLVRLTEGSQRVDHSPANTLSIECGSAGAPKSRFSSGTGADDDTGGLDEDLLESKDPPTCPKGDVVPNSTEIIGLAKKYLVYTGEVLYDPESATYKCEAEEVIETNDPEAEAQLPSDAGCVTPVERATQTLKRCQWRNGTLENITNQTGCPEGSFYTGYVEFPEGSYRIMCCMEEDLPSTEEGIGREWGAENIIETGVPVSGNQFCSIDNKEAIVTWKINGDPESVLIYNPPGKIILTTPAPIYLYKWEYLVDVFDRFGNQIFADAGPFFIYSRVEPIFQPEYFCVGQNRTIQLAQVTGTDGGASSVNCGGAYPSRVSALSCDGNDTFLAIWLNARGGSQPFTFINKFYDVNPVLTCSPGSGSYGVTVYDGSETEVFSQGYPTQPTDFKYYCRANTQICPIA